MNGDDKKVIYKITDPDGTEHKLPGPPGKTREQVIEEIKRQQAQQPAVDAKTDETKTEAPSDNPAMEFLKSAGTGAVGVAADIARGEQLESEQRALAFAPPEQINAGPKVPTGAELTKAFGLHDPQGFWGDAGELTGQFAINPATYFGPGSAVGKFLISASAIFGGAGGKQMGFGPAGTIGGAAVGGFAPIAILKSMSPVFINGAREAATQFLESVGVKSMTAGQRTGSKAVGYWESIYGDAPLAGGKLSQAAEQQGREFTSAVLKPAGINADLATPQVIDKGYTDIGRGLDQVAAQGSLRLDSTFAQDALRVNTEYDLTVSAADRKPYIEKKVNDLLGMAVSSPTISGEQLQALRTDLLERQRGSVKDAEYSQALGDLLKAVDNAIGRSLPQALQDQWALLRRQYRNLTTINRALGGAGEQAAEGIVTPARLRSALTATLRGRTAYNRGRGDFSALSHAANLAMTPLPNSGTSQREMARSFVDALKHSSGHFFGASAGGGAGFAIGGPAGAGIGAAVGGMVLPGAIGRATMSRPVQQYMGGKIPGQAAARRAQQSMPGSKATMFRSTFPALPEMLNEGVGNEE